VGKSIPERPSQLPETAEFMRFSPDGHPLWLDPEAGQHGIVNILLPDGELRHATAAELQIVRKSQVPKPYSRRRTTTKKESVMPRKTSPAKKAKQPDWRDLKGKELGKYLLEHKTISDKLHTTKKRHKGEDRESFLRRVYGLEDES
jgi:hypothetical protein